MNTNEGPLTLPAGTMIPVPVELLFGLIDVVETGSNSNKSYREVNRLLLQLYNVVKKQKDATVGAANDKEGNGVNKGGK